TLRNAINLNRINLIGVYGQPSDRRALVRLSNGRYRKVKVGDRIDGGRVLAIGDGPETDIAGAARAGVDAMLIAGGILEAEMRDDGFSPETVVAILAEYGVEARWIAPQLVWS
ncbi:MAG: HAD hydrolase-like protein, partial [Pseudomonadota bacterium]|nr:HAD hydrolase-like protein [Pseudomonadota bacterium]